MLGVRPQDVVLGRGAELSVRRVERLGGETRVHLDLEQRELVAIISGESTAPGKSAVPDAGAIAVELPPEALHWFDAESGGRLG